MGWSDQNVIAQLVIVEGANDGIFVYNGTPAAGNLLVSIAAVGGTDNYGNTYSSGIEIFHSATHPGLSLTTKDAAETVAATLDSVVIGSGSTRQGQLQLNGPLFGHGGSIIELNSSSVDNSIIGDIKLIVASATMVDVTSTGTTIAGAVTATGGTISTPTLITTDSWNGLTLAAGWSNVSNEPVYSYRLLPDGNVQITGSATHSSITGITQLGNAALPAAYRPTTTQYVAPGQTGQCGLQITHAGIVNAVPPASGSSTARCNGTFPLNL